jgi:hypothetical protein
MADESNAKTPTNPTSLVDNLFEKGEYLHSLALNSESTLGIKQNILEEARMYYQQTTELDPEHSIAFFQIARIQETLKEYADAIKNYDKAIYLITKMGGKAHQSYLPHAYSNRGIIKQNSDLEGAEDDYNKAINLGATFYQPYLYMALIQEKKKNTAETKKYYIKALERIPQKELKTKTFIIDKLNDIIFAEGNKFFEKKNYLLAASCYKSVIENNQKIDVNEPSVFYNHAQSLYLLFLFPRKKHNDTALSNIAKKIKDDIDKALLYDLDPKHKGDAYYLQACAEQILKDHKAIIRLYTKFSQLKNQDEKLANQFKALYQEAQDEIKKCSEKLKGSLHKLATLSKPTNNHPSKKNSPSDASKKSNDSNSSNTTYWSSAYLTLKNDSIPHADKNNTNIENDDDTPKIPSYSTLSPGGQKS